MCKEHSGLHLTAGLNVIFLSRCSIIKSSVGIKIIISYGGLNEFKLTVPPNKPQFILTVKVTIKVRK